jgi:hypothetical protein
MKHSLPITLKLCSYFSVKPYAHYIRKETQHFRPVCVTFVCPYSVNSKYDCGSWFLRNSYEDNSSEYHPDRTFSFTGKLEKKGQLRGHKCKPEDNIKEKTVMVWTEFIGLKIGSSVKLV